MANPKLLFFELQTEHTEGVRKLNFVVSLVDAILEVISARGTPFTVLAESVAIKQVSAAMFLKRHCHQVMPFYYHINLCMATGNFTFTPGAYIYVFVHL